MRHQLLWLVVALSFSGPPRGLFVEAQGYEGYDTGTINLKSRTPEPVQLEPGRIPGRRTGRKLLDHTEMHNIQILQDIKAAEMAARASTFTYFADVNEPQGYPEDCMVRYHRGGPTCYPEIAAVREALNILFHSTSGYWWRNNKGWRTSMHYCSWGAIGCDARGIIRTIHMDDHQLEDWYNGTIPNEICNITTLYEISMACNMLQGTIPNCLDKMPDLQYLDLHGNVLKGAMPDSVTKLKRLLYLDLTYNQLDGYDFVNGQPSMPWGGWSKATRIDGNGRIASPNLVFMEPNVFTLHGRLGSGDTNVNLTTTPNPMPGVGGVLPIDYDQQSYGDKIPVSPGDNYPPSADSNIPKVDYKADPRIPRNVPLDDFNYNREFWAFRPAGGVVGHPWGEDEKGQGSLDTAADGRNEFVQAMPTGPTTKFRL